MEGWAKQAIFEQNASVSKTVDSLQSYY